MWGNIKGWILAVVLVAIITFAISSLLSATRVPPQTDISKPANLAVLALPVAPNDAWPLASEDRDAGDDYEQAIAAWGDGGLDACNRYQKNPTGELPKSIKLLVDARHCREMHLFSRDLPYLIGYDNQHPKLAALVSAGNHAVTLGAALNYYKRPKEAASLCEAAFSLGRNLFNERLTHLEYFYGMQLMAEAAGAMEKIEPPGTDLYAHLSAFDKGRMAYGAAYDKPIWNALAGVGSQVEVNAGDVFAFAADSHERMWRVEATLQLGRFRYESELVGVRARAIREIKLLVNDADPAVAAAAAAARDLTIENYHLINPLAQEDTE